MLAPVLLLALQAVPTDVILVTIDTLRADRVGAYGSKAGATKTMDALAARGAVVEEAVVQAPQTRPSHASLLTGLLPFEHGLRDNASPPLAKTVPTLATTLKAKGYATAAFIAGYPVSRSSGLDSGFEVFGDPFGGDADFLFDGNSVMKTNAVNWSAFYHETDANYPLLNRILAVPRLRQRYLAHMRTLIVEKLQPSIVSALLDGYEAMIDTIVQNDPKKLYTYNAFQNELNVLQTYVTNRRNFLLSNSEVSQPAPTISDVEMESGGTIWQAPDDQTSAWVRPTVTATNGISAVRLFYSDQLEGRFQNILMADDGAHQDGASGDGVYGGGYGLKAMGWPAPCRTMFNEVHDRCQAGFSKSGSVSVEPTPVLVKVNMGSCQRISCPTR